MFFDLQQAKIYQAVKLGRTPWFQFADLAKTLFGVGTAILFLLFLIAFIGQAVPESYAAKLLGLALLSLVGFLCLFLLSLFFQLRLKLPELPTSIEEVLNSPEKYNLAEFLSFEVARATEKAIQVARKTKPPQVTSSLLLYFLLQDNPKLNFVFARANLDLENIKKLLETKLFPKGGLPFSFSFWFKEEVELAEDFEKSLRDALFEAIKKKHARIELGDMITALAKQDPIFQDILMEADLKVEDIENLTWWLESLEERIAREKRFWEKGNLARYGTLAREWTAGYTPTLDRFSKDWTDIAKHRGFEEIIGHDKELEAVERVLVRGELNNVLLVGEPGTGRRSIVHALAQKNLLGESVEGLKYKRVVELDIVSLLSAMPSMEETEHALDQIFAEALSAGNVILVLDEFHNYVGGGLRPGVVDVSGVLANYLSIPQFQLVAITSFAGLHKTIEQNPSLLELFEKVEVQEPTIDQTIRILEDKALALERQYQKFIT